MIRIEKYLKDYGEYYSKTQLVNATPKVLTNTINEENGLFWINNKNKYKTIPDNSIVVLSQRDYDLLLEKKELRNKINELVVENPRLAFAQILTDHYSHLSQLGNVYLSHLKKVGYNVYLSNEVNMGENVIIGNNVTIYGKVKIGNNVTIADNSIIGTIGIGFERFKNGKLYKFPQIGGVIIGDNVEIGSHCDIKRGTLGNTIISNGCKLGSYNNIGHNTFMGENCLITVKCILCGSSRLGNNVVMGTHSSVKENITIPHDTTIGGMSFVTKNFTSPGQTLIGIPAKIK